MPSKPLVFDSEPGKLKLERGNFGSPETCAPNKRKSEIANVGIRLQWEIPK
jgi:hypothetical protein